MNREPGEHRGQHEREIPHGLLLVRSYEIRCRRALCDGSTIAVTSMADGASSFVIYVAQSVQGLPKRVGLLPDSTAWDRRGCRVLSLFGRTRQPARRSTEKISARIQSNWR